MKKNRPSRPTGRPLAIAVWASIALLLSAAPLLGGSAAAGPPPATPDEAEERRALHLETFDKAWRLIHERYWDPEFGGVDWQGVRDELRPRAAEAADREELREVLGAMIARLGQSHFGILPGFDEEPGSGGTLESLGSATETGSTDSGSIDSPTTDSTATADGASPSDPSTLDDQAPVCREDFGERLVAALRADSGRGEATPGFDVRLVGDDILVARVDAGSPAAGRGVRPGWKVLEVGNQPLADVGRCLDADLPRRTQRQLVFELVRGLLEGDLGETVAVELADGNGNPHRLELEREIPDDAQRVRFGNLPPMQFRFSDRWLEAPGGTQIGYIRFNVWMMPVAAAFEESLIEMKHADGLILDLRGNPGGVAGLSAGLAGYFVATRESLGKLKYRRDQLELKINPRTVTRDGQALEIYQGPLAILIDQFTASTSEIFSAGLQDFGRARIFGETSAAAALPAVIEELPNGDYLMHALADLERPSGERVEGIGVIPDEEVAPTREGLLEGRDEVLERALEWIAAEARSPQSAPAPQRSDA